MQQIQIDLKNWTGKYYEHLTHLQFVKDQIKIDQKARPPGIDQIPRAFLIREFFRPIEKLKNFPYFYLQVWNTSSDKNNGENTQDPKDVKQFLDFFKFLRVGSLEKKRPPKAGVFKTEKIKFYICPPDNLSTFNENSPIRCYYEEVIEVKDTPSSAIGGVHPRDMKTRSETHEWIFGAFAELIHNSFDAHSKKLQIYVKKIRGKHVIGLIDDGMGMSYDGLCQMLTYGHEDVQNSEERVGKFGVGFKTGAMRIADDALILTRDKNSQSLGFFSQTLNSGKSKVEVPIVTWSCEGESPELGNLYLPPHKAQENLETITKNSLFKTEEALQNEFFPIFESTGTHIILYNIRENDLDLRADIYDIQIPKVSENRLFSLKRPGLLAKDVKIDYSLRKYIEMMFMETEMAVTLRDKEVDVKKKLKLRKVKQFAFNKEGCVLQVGFSEEEEKAGLGGIHMYWHNVLIKSYYRVGFMVHNTELGSGFIGVIECNQLLPFNNKQDFQHDQNAVELDNWLSQTLEDYYYEVKPDVKVIPKQLEKLKKQKGELTVYDWVQCSKCSKYRKYKKETMPEVPEEWFCWLNPDTNYNSCEVPEEESSLETTINVKGSSYLNEKMKSKKEKREKEVDIKSLQDNGSGQETDPESDNEKVVQLKKDTKTKRNISNSVNNNKSNNNSSNNKSNNSNNKSNNNSSNNKSNNSNNNRDKKRPMTAAKGGVKKRKLILDDDNGSGNDS